MRTENSLACRFDACEVFTSLQNFPEKSYNAYLIIIFTAAVDCYSAEIQSGTPFGAHFGLCGCVFAGRLFGGGFGSKGGCVVLFCIFLACTTWRRQLAAAWLKNMSIVCLFICRNGSVNWNCKLIGSHIKWTTAKQRVKVKVDVCELISRARLRGFRGLILPPFVFVNS